MDDDDQNNKDDSLNDDSSVKNSRRKRKTPTTKQEYILSEELSAIVGSAQLTQSKIIEQVQKYAHENSLLNEDEPLFIQCNDTLRIVTGLDRFLLSDIFTAVSPGVLGKVDVTEKLVVKKRTTPSKNNAFMRPLCLSSELASLLGEPKVILNICFDC
jgi:chromatin remodeling complex protein RSC6